MKKKKRDELFKDKDGITYKYPERSCEKCVKNPCMRGMETFVCDFAKYGCRQYENS